MRCLVLVLAVGCSGFLQAPPKHRVAGDEVTCTTSYALPAVDTVVWAAAVIGTVLTFGRFADGDCEAGECLGFVAGSAMTIAVPIVAADGYWKVHRCREITHEVRVEIAAARENATKVEARNKAWQITKQAAAAARAGDCEAARSASDRVVAVDQEFHASVFVRDAAIAKCLTK